ncbi:lycopene cyclase domain-containing protein [Amnibacterium endophyticum]|uniref:Lycopene cyclase domain-containing protein n=1 Tax=Amnibacterium endophyticum TaxID=2109337 RepID=A0ABW4LAH9_9MICO
MTGLYLGALLVSIAGLVTLDLRLRLFLFAAPARAAVVLVAGVAGFLAWDAAGVGLGIFFEGPSTWLVGVDLAPDIPLEELFFLILLCLSAMHAFLLAQRLLGRGTVRSGGERA